MEQQEQIQNEPLRQPAEEKSEPKKPMVISTPAAIVTAGVIIALALIFSGKGMGAVKNNAKVADDQQQVENKLPAEPVSIRANDHVRGDLSKAEVTIVEYSDSDCPYCQRFHVTMQDVMKKYGTKVAWVYRHFPLNIHPNAVNEAITLECVGQLGGNDKYWSFLDSIIDITVSPDKSASVLGGIASGLGIDAKALTNCAASQATKSIVEGQAVEAQSLGAQGTPYSIAIGKNGKQVVIPGALPIDQVSKIIDELMK